MEASPRPEVLGRDEAYGGVLAVLVDITNPAFPLTHEKVMRNLELLSKEVMPKLEERGHRVDATVKV